MFSVCFDTPPRADDRAGRLLLLPGLVHYAAKCAQPCTFLAWGEKPFDILYADPKDDPRSQQAHK
jgi:hypothetical protein